jgi:GrpB-like predicted nucleotidyltransferase (UPF0157 family)
MREIIVVPYDSKWPEMYRSEANEIRAIFGRELISIHHIGSTSIPGMSAKPIIDIMPVVGDIDRVEAFNPGMIGLGYEVRGEYGIAGRRYFVKRDRTGRTHHVHTYAPDNPEVARHLDFRDYLITHPDGALVYARLKLALAEAHPHDIEAYMAGKDSFIKETIGQAQRWRQTQIGSNFPVEIGQRQ